MTCRRVLISGGASGIGLAMGQYFASAGHQVVLADLDAERVAEQVQILQQQALSVTGVQLDVCNSEQVAQLADELAQQGDGKGIDVLVNCAGLQHVARLEEFPVARWQQLINVMLVGPALLCQAMLPAMRQQGYGRIINIGSIHSLVASPYKSAYVAAKHGLLGLSKTLALETADCDITVNTLCPAYVKTRLVEQQISAQARENDLSEEDVINKIMLEPMPKKAFITTEELSAAALFLISDAARNITGQAISLDGGWTIR